MEKLYDETLRPITSFSGNFRFLSNFWPVKISWEGLDYPSVEHAYQAAKTLEHSQRQYIQFQETPGKAKRAGQEVTIREDWEEVKVEIMAKLIVEKFYKYGGLQMQLLGTQERKLVEGNTWNDTFWGVCNGVGKNCLGILLMEARRTLVINNGIW